MYKQWQSTVVSSWPAQDKRGSFSELHLLFIVIYVWNVSVNMNICDIFVELQLHIRVL